MRGHTTGTKSASTLSATQDLDIGSSGAVEPTVCLVSVYSKVRSAPDICLLAVLPPPQLSIAQLGVRNKHSNREHWCLPTETIQAVHLASEKSYFKEAEACLIVFSHR